MGKALADWLRANRTIRAWDQQELADRISVNVGTISRWERGEAVPQLAQFRALCVLFDCSADLPLGLSRKRRRSRTEAEV